MPHPGASAVPPSDASEPWLAAVRPRVFSFVRRYLTADDAEDEQWVASATASLSPERFRAEAILNAGIGYLSFGRDPDAARALRHAHTVIRQYGYLHLDRSLDDARRVLQAGRGRELRGWLPVRGRRPHGATRPGGEARQRMERQVPSLKALMLGVSKQPPGST